MLAMAAVRLGFHVHIYEPGAAPAAEVAGEVTHAGYDDGAKLESDWNESFAAYKAAYPAEAAEYERMLSGELPDGWEAALETILDQENSTRKLSGFALNALSPALPELVGGSADLNHSNMTEIKNEPYFEPGSYEGRNFHFGVREHGMGSVVNGMVLHGGLLPYCATFLIFTDYMRAAIRLSALSEVRVLYVMTHDSVALGEDGPTHQPVETIASLRLIPNLHCFRPADVKETVGAYKSAIKQTKTPSLFAFSRQGLKNLDGTSVEGTMKGGYTVVDAANPEVILIATGSEVALAVEAAGVLASEGKAVRVVSMPSCDVFDAQPKEYRDSVLPPSVTKRVTIEAGVTGGWYKYAGTEGAVIGMDRFGASAPGGLCMEKFGFTVENICNTARGLLA
ncbi:MAG: transketolase C-terminal domain-containing protein, partial [Cyanobacteria bacterium J06555_12]